VLKIFGREVVAAACCGKEEGAFPAKLLRGRPGRDFRSVGLDTTVRKTPVAPPTTHDLHAASLANAGVPRAHDLCFFTWSSDRAVDACRWRAQQLLGPLALCSLKRACSWNGLSGATVGVLDTGVSRSTCY
jgi:hypothetical protein